MTDREHPFPGNRTYKLERFESSSVEPILPEERHEAELGEANLLSSEMVNPDGWVHPPVGAVYDGLFEQFSSEPKHFHRPVLDIDFPAQLMPSSTPGKFHLYLDKPMTWRAYEKLLNALADAGVIEHGYAGASIDRKATFVRLPWIKKGDV